MQRPRTTDVMPCPVCGFLLQYLNAWDGAPVRCDRCESDLEIRLRPTFSPHSRSTPGTPPQLRWLARAGVGLLAWKALQALFDVDYGDGEYPASVRAGLIAEHIAAYGCWCPACGRRVPRRELTINHKVPMAANGRTSLANAEALCRSCNCSRGARYNAWDWLRGRN